MVDGVIVGAACGGGVLFIVLLLLFYYLSPGCCGRGDKEDDVESPGATAKQPTRPTTAKVEPCMFSS
jgi:hypothetical protein